MNGRIFVPIERVTIHPWSPWISDRDRQARPAVLTVGHAEYDPDSDTHAVWRPVSPPRFPVYAVAWSRGEPIYASGPVWLFERGQTFRFGPLPLEATMTAA